MPQSRPPSRTTLVRLVLLALLGWALCSLRRTAPDVRAANDPIDFETATWAQESAPPAPTPERGRGRRRRFATSLAFATLFFAGAALSAGAGDALVQAIESDTTTTDTTTAAPPPAVSTDESIPPESAPSEEAPAPAPPESESPPAEGTIPPDGETPPAESEQPAPGTDPGTEPEPAAEAPIEGTPAPDPTEPAPATEPTQDETPSDGTAGPDESTPAPAPPPGPPVIEPHSHAEDGETRTVDPEAETIGTFATVWLHRALPDPTPPARRLAPAFARTLRAEARRTGVDWAILLGGLRAEGRTGRIPATRAYVRWFAEAIEDRMQAGEWQAFLALRGRTSYADRAHALTRYNRAVGLRALVRGLDSSKKALAERTLADDRIDVYASGRADIAAGRIDVRVLILLRYLAESHGQVTVSSLQSGHRLYARPGVVSAHIYGLAADIATLGNQSIMGNSAPGGVTEKGVRDVLLLPAEIRPQQVISLLGLGGPSFPMSNHADHIHVGF